MDIHYLNEELIGDIEVNEMEQEVIIYESKENGGYKLAGVSSPSISK